MRTSRLILFVLAISTPLLLAPAALARDLSFEDRVKAQAAIERVYYSHQLGTLKSFEAALPRAALETKVHTYLKQSVALEEIWKTPITAEMLSSERRRMEERSRMPDRLRELYAALGNDPTLVDECLVRPLLVDRLARRFFASDGPIHSEARLAAEALRRGLLDGRVDRNAPSPHRRVLDFRRAGPDDSPPGGGSIADGPDGLKPRPQELSPVQFEQWARRASQSVGQVGALLEEPEAFVTYLPLAKTSDRLQVAAFSVSKKSWDQWWAAIAPALDERVVRTVAQDGSLAVSPPTGSSTTTLLHDDTWENGSLDEFPDPRSNHTAVWTGSVMIVWGGLQGASQSTGGRYNPATDTWTPTSTLGAPVGRTYLTAVWTGSRMIVWGGYGNGSLLQSGGQYDPVSDTWTPTSMINAPTARYSHTAVWAGNRMIVWGGTDAARLDSGGVYDPISDTWSPTSIINAPTARYLHTAVWTGKTMIIWGGSDTNIYMNTGARYDPIADVWSPTTVANAPMGRQSHTAVWTGSRMIVWGGDDGLTGLHQDGGRYDPVADAWTATSLVNAPSARDYHTAIWTGSRMIVWGGDFDLGPQGSGGIYDPAADAWTATSTTNAPARRVEHAAVWTGSLMIVWGGRDGGNAFGNGGRYNPVSDSWTPTAATPAPAGRVDHATVWSGNQMIVWGGTSAGGAHLQDGACYNPATDAWTAISTINRPAWEAAGSAVWAGQSMIVWGGYHYDGRYNQVWDNTGAKYDPLTDIWAGTSLANAPSARSGHIAVWTGSRMIIWGGVGTGNLPTQTGGIYDPTADVWAPTSTVGAPSVRGGNVAVWTGSRVLVWGGVNDTPLTSGGLYDPLTDSWTPTSLIGAPEGRLNFGSAWTGARLLVWGGSNGSEYLDSGGQYDPAADAWTAISPLDAPSPRKFPGMVWTGRRLLVWGGELYSHEDIYANTGAQYDPGADTWAPTAMARAPSGRFGHSAVWTGSEMLVWGGYPGPQSGGRYASCSESTFYLDGDGDGHGSGAPAFDACAAPIGYAPDASDCNDSDAANWSTPGEVRDVRFLDAGALNWSIPASPGGSGLLYDLIRSGDPADFVGGGTCVSTNLPATSASDPASPAVGGAFFYLVRAEDGCAADAGDLGTDSSGHPRTARNCPSS